MENFRSMSCREGRTMQLENHHNNNNGGKSGYQPTNMKDLRSYSTSFASSYQVQVHPQPSTRESKPHKNNNGGSKKNKGSNSLKGWSLSDPEMQRKKRVASYKVYAVEGKMKGSLKKSFRWIKHTCSLVVYGWR